MRLDGKVIVITGASEGVGAASANAFRERGARVSLIARSEHKLRAVGGNDAVITAGDITDESVRRTAIERTVERFGGVDLLLNNAGRGLYCPTWQTPLDDARQLFELNFFAALGMIQLAIPHLKKSRGTIVNVSSIAGKMTLPWFTLYSASKYALGSLTDGLRMELKRDGVHTMTVCPGYVDTGFQSHVIGGRPPDRIVRGKRFAVTAAECAQAIVRGVERDARTVVTPKSGWLLVALERLIPSLVDDRLAAILHESA